MDYHTKQSDKNLISISDIGCASLLVTLRFELVGLGRVNEKRVNFLFLKDAKAEQIINDYWQDKEISVSVQSLFNNRKALTNRLYAMQ